MSPRRVAAAPPAAPSFPRLRAAWRLLGAAVAIAPSLARADASVPPPDDKPPSPYKPGDTTPAPPPPRPKRPPQQPPRPNGGPARVLGPGVPFSMRLHPHPPGEPCLACDDDPVLG